MAVVVTDNGREIHLPTKTAEIVRAVVEISAEIELISSGHVIFHFKGRSVIPETLKRHRVREVPGGSVAEGSGVKGV